MRALYTRNNLNEIGIRRLWRILVKTEINRSNSREASLSPSSRRDKETRLYIAFFLWTTPLNLNNRWGRMSLGGRFIY